MRSTLRPLADRPGRSTRNRQPHLRPASSRRTPTYDVAMSYDVVVVGAGFAGSVMAERFASQLRQAGPRDRPPAPRRRERLRRGRRGGDPDPPLRPAHLPHQLAREIVDYLSPFTGWRPYEHRVLAMRPRPAGADPDQPHDRQRACSASRLQTEDEVAAFYAARAEPVDASQRTSEDVVVGRRRPGAVRAVLPRLHAKAVGPRPEPARRVGDRASAHPHQRRRPLLHRPFPDDARRRLHRDVRTHARPPTDRSPRPAPISTTSRIPSTTGRSSTPARSTRSSAIGSGGCRTARCASSSRRWRDSHVPADRHGQLSRRDRGALHPDQRVQAPHRPASTTRRRSSASSHRPPATRTTRSHARRIRPRSTSATGRSPTRRPTSISSAAWRRTSTTTWTRSSPRRSRRSGGSSRGREPRGLTSDGRRHRRPSGPVSSPRT